MGVIHRDIKPENLLLSTNGDLLLADFGWSQKHTPKSGTTKIRLLADFGFCGGCLLYLAPEMLRQDCYAESVDIWAVGVVLFEFLTGVTPFYDKDQCITLELIESAQYQFPSHVPDGARDLISRLLQADCQDRLSLKNVQAHQWIAEHDLEID
jgi:serine/threonine protein kinase